MTTKLEVHAELVNAELWLGTTPLIIFATSRVPEPVLRGRARRTAILIGELVQKLRPGFPDRLDILERVSGRRWIQSLGTSCFSLSYIAAESPTHPLLGKVGDVERYQLRAPGCQRHAEGDQRAVAYGGKAVALDRPNQLHDDIGVGRSFAVRRASARAADAGEHARDDSATLGPVWRDSPRVGIASSVSMGVPKGGVG